MFKFHSSHLFRSGKPRFTNSSCSHDRWGDQSERYRPGLFLGLGYVRSDHRRDSRSNRFSLRCWEAYHNYGHGYAKWPLWETSGIFSSWVRKDWCLFLGNADDVWRLCLDAIFRSDVKAWSHYSHHDGFKCPLDSPDQSFFGLDCCCFSSFLSSGRLVCSYKNQAFVREATGNPGSPKSVCSWKPYGTSSYSN